MYMALCTHAPTQLLIVLWMGVWTVGYARIPARVYLRLIALASGFVLVSLGQTALSQVCFPIAEAVTQLALGLSSCSTE